MTEPVVYENLASELSPEQARGILLKADDNREKCTKTIKNPKGGDVFLFYSEEENKRNDYKVDGINGWSSNGTQKALLGKNNQAIIFRSYFVYKIKGETVFRKYISQLPKNVESGSVPDNSVTLIQYIGKEECVVLKPHGNSQLSERPFVSTLPSVKSVLKQNLKSTDAATYYRSVNGNEEAPRNKKQCENFKYLINKRERVHSDFIMNIYAMNDDLDFVEDFTILPHLSLICIDKPLKTFFNRLLDVAESNQQNVLFSYDTTFKLGDFYFSVLICQLPFLVKNDHTRTRCTFPLAYYFHDKKTEISHDRFFLAVRKAFPKMQELGVFVTDCEKSIRNAVKQVFGQDPLRCWRHLWENIKGFGNKHNYNKEKIENLIENMRRLLYQKTFQDYQELLDKLKAENAIDPNFLKYFQTYIEPDIPSLGRWEIEKFHVVDALNGITTNISEGFNNLFKLIQDRKELSIDCAFLIYYHLSVFYCNELKRGCCDIGDYTWTEAFKGNKMDFSTVHLRQSISLNELKKMVNSCSHEQCRTALFPSSAELSGLEPTTTQSTSSSPHQLAQGSDQSQAGEGALNKCPQETSEPINANYLRALSIVNNRHISYHLPTDKFYVEVENGQCYSVRIDPNTGKGICSCNLAKKCVHILAARLYEDPDFSDIEVENSIIKIRNAKKGFKTLGRKHGGHGFRSARPRKRKLQPQDNEDNLIEIDSAGLPVNSGPGTSKQLTGEDMSSAGVNLVGEETSSAEVSKQKLLKTKSSILIEPRRTRSSIAASQQSAREQHSSLKEPILSSNNLSSVEEESRLRVVESRESSRNEPAAEKPSVLLNIYSPSIEEFLGWFTKQIPIEEIIRGERLVQLQDVMTSISKLPQRSLLDFDLESLKRFCTETAFNKIYSLLKTKLEKHRFLCARCCQKAESGDSIGCAFCNNRFHLDCFSSKDSSLRRFKQNSSGVWLCDPCLKGWDKS